MKNYIGKIIGVILVFIIAGFILWMKFFPAGQIEFLKNSNNAVADLLCMYPVTVSGESMEPFFKHGTIVSFDKCFDIDELQKGTVVIYNDGNLQRIGIIRYIINADRVIYRVSNEARSADFNDIIISDIVGINKTDTSSSAYVYDDNSAQEQYTVNPDDYVSELYLGAVGKEESVDNAAVRKISSFDLNRDAFCFVINPIHNLTNVDIEILNFQSNTVEFNINDIVYSTGKNTNCMNAPEAFPQLESGNYTFKVFVENILIASLEFSVD